MMSIRQLLFTGMCVAFLGSVGCSKVDSPTAPSQSPLSSTSDSPGASEARATSVQLCHRTESGHYNLITVSVSAEAAHRAHGDGKVGERVPGEPTQVFSRNCEPVDPPSLSVSPSSVTTGGSVTVTLTNGTGGSSNWLSLATAGSPDTTYLQRSSLSIDVTTQTWTVTMPMTAGIYEFRLFEATTRLAASPPVTVTPSGPTLSVNPSIVTVGSSVTLTLTNGPGGLKDWLAFAPMGAADTTYLHWTYIGPGVTTRTWTIPISTTTTPGMYEVRLFLNDGYTRGGVSNPVTVTAAAPPALTISSSRVTPGAPVTVTLTNGFGGSTDWIALAATSTPNSSWVQWTYVGASVTTRTWTVPTPPATSGTYEFRLFLNNGYTRAATSPPVTVAP